MCRPFSSSRPQCMWPYMSGHCGTRKRGRVVWEAHIPSHNGRESMFQICLCQGPFDCWIYSSKEQPGAEVSLQFHDFQRPRLLLTDRLQIRLLRSVCHKGSWSRTKIVGPKSKAASAWLVCWKYMGQCERSQTNVSFSVFKTWQVC